MDVDELRDEARTVAGRPTGPRRPATTARSCPPTWPRRAGRGSGPLFAAGLGRAPLARRSTAAAASPSEHTAAWTTECAIAEVPPWINMVGLVLTGGSILAFGTPEQQRTHLRGILEAEQVWCQLFSEPGAGSDLASLARRAERDGDDWVVTGQKVWCSNGRVADRGILLARTDPDAPRHAGISFFLVDMTLPGIEVRPLRQMTGGSEFDEVFLDEVRLPADALLGPLHGGWGVAMATLTNERGYIGSAGISLARRLDAIAALDGADDAVTRDRLAELVDPRPGAAGDGPAAGSGGVGGGQPRQARRHGAACSTPPSSRPTWPAPTSMLAGGASARVLGAPGGRIAGGTTQVQKNIIGERLLGLPKEPSPSARSERALGQAAHDPLGGRPGRGRGRGGGPPRWPSSARSRGSRGRRRAPSPAASSSGSKVRTSSARRNAWPSRRRAVISGENGPCTSAARRIGRDRLEEQRPLVHEAVEPLGEREVRRHREHEHRDPVDEALGHRRVQRLEVVEVLEDAAHRHASPARRPAGAVGRRSPSSSRPMVASTIASRVRSERRVRPSVGGASCTMPAGYVSAGLRPAAPPPSRGGRRAASRSPVAHEHVDRRHRAAPVGADQVLVDGHPRRVAGHRHVLVGEDELQRLRAAEQREPRARHRAPPAERPPARDGCTTPGRRAPTRRTWRRGRGPRRRRRSAGWPPHLRLVRGVAGVLVVGGRVGHRADAIRLARRRPARMHRCAR